MSSTLLILFFDHLDPALPLGSVVSLSHVAHQPIHALLHTPSVDSTARDNAPIPIFELAEPQRLANLARALCAWLILFVREDEERSVAEFFFVEHGAEFFRSSREALNVGTVNDEYYGGRVGIVAAPVRADRGLAS